MRALPLGWCFLAVSLIHAEAAPGQQRFAEWEEEPPLTRQWDGPIAAGSASVQERPGTYWLTAGLGFGTRGGAGALGGSYQIGQNLFSVRAAGTVAFFGDELWDAGVLYGRSLRPGVIHFSLAGGIAAVGGSRREALFDPDERIPTTVGFPVEVQLFFRPLRIVGFGLYGFGNVNREESFIGAAAAAQLGRLR
jgi:hypothetical protein